jgi:hypothetical protein
MNLLDIALQLKRMRVPKRDVDNPVMGQSAKRAKEGRLLSTTKAGSRDEHASVLARELATSPESPSGVPQGLYPTQRGEMRSEREGKGKEARRRGREREGERKGNGRGVRECEEEKRISQLPLQLSASEIQRTFHWAGKFPYLVGIPNKKAS